MTKQKLNSSFVKDAAEIVRQVQQAAFDEGWVSTDRALTHDLCIISDLSRNLTYKLENLAAKLKQNEIETLKQEQASAGDSPQFAVGDTVGLYRNGKPEHHQIARFDINGQAILEDGSWCPLHLLTKIAKGQA